MKVKELIESLQKLDPEMEAMRHGYEGGVDNITLLEIEPVALNVNDQWYYGPHEAVYKDDQNPGHEIIKAVIIS
jgi:hypothetical protein